MATRVCPRNPISLAGVVFIALQYVNGAHWAIALRRVPEAMAKLIPLGGLPLKSADS